ncbi:MAG: DUF86 domain-containing protein [Candidatus Woesearchaeota archaeon]
MSRIDDKISEITVFLSELEEIAPSSLEAYKLSIEKRAACERYVEKIVEGLTDLAFFAIKEKKLRVPQDDADAFNILSENKVISSDLAARLKNAKGMRNIISHQYGRIDDEIVYEAVTGELAKDAEKFIEAIKTPKSKAVR